MEMRVEQSKVSIGLWGGKKRGNHGRLPVRSGAKIHFRGGEGQLAPPSCLVTTITPNLVPGRTFSNVTKKICVQWIFLLQSKVAGQEISLPLLHSELDSDL